MTARGLNVSSLDLGAWGGKGLAPSYGFCIPRPTSLPLSLLGSRADSPGEGALARSQEVTQPTDMASESVGGMVSGSLTARTSI